MVLTDLNNDGTPDIVTSGIYGTFIFFNQEKSTTHTRRSASKASIDADNPQSRSFCMS
jgi:hypothetical protein